MHFDLFLGIDYSGAQTADDRLSGLQVFQATDALPQRVTTPAAPAGQHWNWSRREIAEWLITLARRDELFLAGLDHAFGVPISYLDRYGLTTWPEFLDDFALHWPTDRPAMFVDRILDGRPTRVGKPSEFRLTDRWTSSAKSVFRFVGQGQVGKSTHTGIPFLRHIRNEVGDRVHIWPFDGWTIPEGKSAIVEVYPSIFRNRCPCPGTIHERDAYSVARWLKETCARDLLGMYLAPPLTEEERAVADLEGWILGIL